MEPARLKRIEKLVLDFAPHQKMDSVSGCSRRPRCAVRLVSSLQSGLAQRGQAGGPIHREFIECG